MLENSAQTSQDSPSSLQRRRWRKMQGRGSRRRQFQLRRRLVFFDMPTPVGAKPTTPADSDEEVEILAEIKQETEEEDEEVVVS